MRRFGWILALLVPLAATAAEPGRSFERPGALLLNVTRSDLNRILADSFHSKGGPEFEGTRHTSSGALSDMRYRAKLSEPVLELAEGGKASVKFDVRQGSLRIGRIERKIAGRSAVCEDTGVYVDPTRPLEVHLGLGLRIEDGDLRIVPETVDINDAEHRLNLVKPSRCTNAPLPRWLLWWLGKPKLEHYLGNLDEILLERARAKAARLDEDRQLLRRRWQAADGSQVHLFPTSLETGEGSLFVRLTASSTPPGSGPIAEGAQSPRPNGNHSFVALSEGFLNDLSRLAVSRMSGERLRPAGNLGKLLRSSSVYALIPGLRGRKASEALQYSVVFHQAPRFEVKAGDGGQAAIRLALSDVELRLFGQHDGSPVLLGALRVKSGKITVAPYRGVLGGVSFRILENQWSVASTGIRFDDALVAATLQEVTFGRIFETTYRPLTAGGWHVGASEFTPVAFRSAEGYLILELGEEPRRLEMLAAGAPTRTGTLPASR